MLILMCATQLSLAVANLRNCVIYVEYVLWDFLTVLWSFIRVLFLIAFGFLGHGEDDYLLILDIGIMHFWLDISLRCLGGDIVV